jgi:hypothetical protein
MGIVATPYPICSVRRYPKQYFMGKEGTRLCEIGPAAPTAPDHSCELGHHSYRECQLPIAARRELSRNGLRIKAMQIARRPVI